jgi:rhamnulose-1-phosphate aldolase
MITHIPEGLGWVPFCVPGSDDLMNASLNALKTNRVIVWAKHGIVARSEIGLKNALDLIEFTEAGARYEFFNLASGGQGEGLLPNEIGAICDFYHFEQNII